MRERERIVAASGSIVSPSLHLLNNLRSRLPHEDESDARRVKVCASVYLSPTQNILPFTQLVLKLVVCALVYLSPTQNIDRFDRATRESVRFGVSVRLCVSI
jgi:hypothetical protein